MISLKMSNIIRKNNNSWCEGGDSHYQDLNTFTVQHVCKINYDHTNKENRIVNYKLPIQSSFSPMHALESVIYLRPQEVRQSCYRNCLYSSSLPSQFVTLGYCFSLKSGSQATYPRTFGLRNFLSHTYAHKESTINEIAL